MLRETKDTATKSRNSTADLEMPERIVETVLFPFYERAGQKFSDGARVMRQN